MKVFLAAGSLLLLLAANAAAETIEGYYPGDVRLWNRMFEGTPLLNQPSGVPLAGIVPHHDIDLVTIGRYYKSLAVRPSIVVLLSPNHFEWGTAPFILPRSTTFQTTDGPLVPDDTSVRQYAARLGEKAQVTEEAWSAEHGIYTHAPFIRHFFADAKFIPILVKMGATREDTEDLARALADLLPPDALLLASVDFSHYQIAPVAHFHDLTTARRLANGEPELLNSEVDSPESLTIVSRYGALRGGVAGTQVALTSSGQFSKNPLSETTSHQYWTFVSGRPSAEPVLTFVLGGFLARDGRLGLPTSWPWDRYHTDPNPERADLELVAGKEARFLNGFDYALLGDLSALVESGSPGLRTAFYGWNEKLPFEEQLSILPRRPFVAVVRNSREHSFGDAELRRFADFGVNLVLDRGNTGAAGPYQLGNMLVVPSLGDLTAEGDSGGKLLMAAWRPTGWGEQQLFNVEIRRGRPQAIHQFGFPEP